MKLRICNEDKTQFIENPDLKKGYLRNDRLLVSNEELEQSHFKEIKHDNGGISKIKVIDIPYKPAEYEDIQVYIPYTEEQFLNKEINELTENLVKTDYIANKLAEAVSKYISTGDNTDVLLLREKYAIELVNREQWRKEIDKLQQELKINETKS